MNENKLINSRNNDIQSMDHHVLPDTLTADEWQTLVFSGFLNEYKKEQINNHIEELNQKIKTLESLNYSANKKSTFNVVIELIRDIFLIIFGVVCNFIVFTIVGAILELLFKNTLGRVYGNIFGFIVYYSSMPIRKLFNIFPNATSSNEHSIIQITLAAVMIGIVFGMIKGIKGIVKNTLEYKKNKKELEKLEQERQTELEKAKKELEDYLPKSKHEIEECESNLKEIYGKNLIPDMYHDTYSLGMLYGYFACKAANTFQDAAKEYLQDQRTNQLVERMQGINEILVEIAKQKSVLNHALGISNEKLDKLIEQNDRSIIGKLFPNNPISKIYAKTKSLIRN